MSNTSTAIATQVLDPGPAESKQADQRPAPRVASLSGKRIAWVGNHKQNADVVLGTLARGVQDATHALEVVAHEKRGPNVPTDPAVLDRLARECDAVIIGLAD
ncbi:MAG: hypothetical protein Q7T26_06390 [Dehalococcoidia bacterium]|nr:hypothetical protein [Dehalococcoidia bacterium]